MVFYGVFALVTLTISAALLRRHLPRLIFAITTVVVVMAGIYLGYVR